LGVGEPVAVVPAAGRAGVYIGDARDFVAGFLFGLTYLRPLSADFDARAASLRQKYGLPPTNKHGPIGAEEGISAVPADKLRAFMGDFRALMTKATLDDYVNVIDYIVRRIGVDHVGIETDFNHGAGIDGFNSEGEAPNVTRELVRRGYSEADIRKIRGGNFLRVSYRVEAVAKELN
jgi:membrane dipeptidase